MPGIPFPIQAESLEELMTVSRRIFDDLYMDRIGGSLLGDVFSIGADDILALALSTAGGLEKSGGYLRVKNNPTGGLISTASGEAIKLKTGGGVSTDAEGLYILGPVAGWSVGVDDIHDAAGLVGLSSRITVGDDIRIWAGSVTPASAPFYVTESGALVATSATVTGTISATTGAIGGWVIGATSIEDAAGLTGLSSAVTGGDDIRIWAGDATAVNAHFRVTESGALYAASATIRGDITAVTGTIGGWVVEGSTIKDVIGFVGLSSAVTMADDIRIWAGAVDPTLAPFSVTEAGVLVASSATITGDITATTGNFRAVTLGKTGVASGTLTLELLDGGGDTYINYGRTTFAHTDLQSGFIIGIDDSDGNKAKVFFGDWLQWFSWDGATLEYTKGLVIEPEIRLWVDGEIKTQNQAVDGSEYSAGILINNSGIFAAGGSQNTTNANVRILSDGTAYFKGSVTADTGYIGGADGWTIAAKTLTGAADSKIVSGVLESSDWGAAAGSQINLFASTIKFGGSASPKFQIDTDGTLSAVGGIFKSAVSGARTQIDADGITVYATVAAGIYNLFDYNDGTTWGSGARVQIGNPSRLVPLYFPAGNSYADIHFVNRAAAPSGDAEVGDVCVVLGELQICTVAGTPGTWVGVGAGSSGLTWSLITANPSPAVKNSGYLCNTTAGGFTVTLPAAPDEGDVVAFADAAGTFDTNNLTIGRAALNIMGLGEDMTVSTKYAAFQLVYASAALGWRIV